MKIRSEDAEQVTDLNAVETRVPHRCLTVEAITITSAHPLNADVAALDQIVEDSLHGSLGYPDFASDISLTSIGILGQKRQHQRVV